MTKVLIVLEKEWLDLRLQRALLLLTLGLPIGITLFGVVAFYAAGRLLTSGSSGNIMLTPELAGLSAPEIGQALVGKQFSVLFLLLPVFIPSVIASYAIVGEKRERTLEPVLATPIRTWELLTGKSLAALLPALVITLLSAGMFIAGLLAFAVSERVRAVVVTPGWLLTLALDAPLLSLIGLGLIVLVSSRVNDPRTAQQFSAVLVVPIMGLLFGQLAGAVVLAPALALGLAVLLAAIAGLTLRLAIGVFQREAILTRWR